MPYGIAPLPMTAVSDLYAFSNATSFVYNWAAVDKISTDRASARPCSIAEIQIFKCHAVQSHAQFAFMHRHVVVLLHFAQIKSKNRYLCPTLYVIAVV